MAKHLCATNVTGLLLVCFVIMLMFSGLLQKDLFKGKCSLARSYFKQNYWHACRTSFAIFFPFPSCRVSLHYLSVYLHREPTQSIFKTSYLSIVICMDQCYIHVALSYL